MKNTNIEELAAQWRAAKEREASANAERLAIEAQLLGQLETKEEGRTSVTLGNGLKLIATAKLIYKADVDALLRATMAWPAHLQPIKVKRETDEALLRQIRAERPDLWRTLSAVVTTKPAKVHILVESACGL